jgi:hypothetical protein
LNFKDQWSPDEVSIFRGKQSLRGYRANGFLVIIAFTNFELRVRLQKFGKQRFAFEYSNHFF